MNPAPAVVPGSVLDGDRFLIGDRDEIVRILTGLALDRSMLSAHFDGDGILLSAVLAVVADDDAVYLDPNANAQANARLLASKRVSFVAQRAGITVKWTSGRPTAAEYEGRPAFRTALPESLRRVQRRAYFRVATPIAQPVLCSVFLGPSHMLDLALIDISVEGICVHVPTPPDPAIQPGAHFDTCRLDLPGIGVVAVGLTVQNVWEIAVKNGAKQVHAGLFFSGLRPQTQSAIQRYVTQLDRQRIATLPRH